MRKGQVNGRIVLDIENKEKTQILNPDERETVLS
jgi:hypothetical protein